MKWVQLLATPYDVNVSGKTTLFDYTDAPGFDSLYTPRSAEEIETFDGCVMISMNLTGLHLTGCLDILEAWDSDPDRKFSYHYFYEEETVDRDTADIVNAFLLETDNESVEEELTEYERLLVTALLCYMCDKAPADEQNISTLAPFIDAMELRADDENFRNAVDLVFRELEPESLCGSELARYEEFRKLPAGLQVRTVKSVAGRLEKLGFQTDIDELLDERGPWDD